MRIPMRPRVSVHSSQANSNFCSQKRRTGKPLTALVSALAAKKVYVRILLALCLVAGSIAGFVVWPRLVTQAAIPLGPEHVLSIPYYSVKGDWDSTLTLNNAGHTQLTPSVKLYSLDGEAMQLPAVSLQPNDYTALRLSELVAASPRKSQFQEGNIELRFNSDDLFALAPQLTVSDSKHGLSFDMEPAMGFKSSRLEGLWWSLDEKTSGQVMLSNTTADALGAQLSVEWGGTVLPTPPVSVLGHQTVVLEIEKLLKDTGVESNGIGQGGISISHSGSPG